jgi:hypothetical protein
MFDLSLLCIELRSGVFSISDVMVLPQRLALQSLICELLQNAPGEGKCGTKMTEAFVLHIYQ